MEDISGNLLERLVKAQAQLRERNAPKERAMTGMGSATVLKRKPQTNAVNERQHFVQLTADMLKAPFKVVLWKTINWPTDWIRDFYFYCMKEGNPPARLWYGLYKKNVKRT